jgi:hypothetical protein
MVGLYEEGAAPPPRPREEIERERAAETADAASIVDRLYAAASAGEPLPAAPEMKRAQIVDGDKASVINPDTGTVSLIPLKDLDEAISLGFVPENHTEYVKRKTDEHYREATGEAAATGALGSLTLGLSNVVGGEEWRRHAARLKAESPTATMLGSLGGIAASMGVGVGGLAASGGRTLAEKIIAKGGGKLAESLAQGGRLAGAVTGASEAAAAGLPIGFGESMGAQALEHPETGEFSATKALKAGVLAAAFGAGFSLAGSALGWGGSAIKSKAQQVFLKRSGYAGMDKNILAATARETAPFRSALDAIDNQLGGNVASTVRSAADALGKKTTTADDFRIVLANQLAGTGRDELLALAKTMNKGLPASERLGRDVLSSAMVGNPAPLVDGVADMAARSGQALAKLEKAKAAYAAAFPSLDKLMGLPPGMGKVALGVGAGVLSGNPVVGVLSSLAPIALRKLVGTPYAFTKGMMRQDVANMLTRILGISGIKAGAETMSGKEVSELREDLAKTPPIDAPALAQSLTDGGWSAPQAASYAKFQSWRDSRIRDEVDKASDNPMSRAALSSSVVVLNDPRIALAKLADGSAKPSDINILRDIMETFEPGSWAPMEEIARNTLDTARHETLPANTLAIMRMVLGKPASPLAAIGAPPAGPAKPAGGKLGLDTASLMTQSQKLQKGLGEA